MMHRSIWMKSWDGQSSLLQAMAKGPCRAVYQRGIGSCARLGLGSHEVDTVIACRFSVPFMPQVCFILTTTGYFPSKSSRVSTCWLSRDEHLHLFAAKADPPLRLVGRHAYRASVRAIRSEIVSGNWKLCSR